MKKWKFRFRGLAFGFAALLLCTSGCPDEKKIYRPIYPEAGSLEFSAAKTIDASYAIPGSTVVFDKDRMASYGGADRALIVYVSDDGSNTSRLNVIRFDRKNNPIFPEFRTPEKFDANTGDVIDAKIRMDKSGDGLLVWTQISGTLPRLFASIYTGSTDSFSFPRVIDYAASGENLVPQGVDAFDFALDEGGNGIIGFYENSASPCEAYGVYYDNSLKVFNPPEAVGLSGGEQFSTILAAAGPIGTGGLSFMQDTESGPGSKNCAAGSKFSSESSLSSFSAPIRVNENTPPFDNDVREIDFVCLPNGDLLWLIEQDDASGRSRVLYRRMDFGTGNFEDAAPVDLAAGDATHEFSGPAVVPDPNGNAIALFLRTTPDTPALFYNIFNGSNESFSTGGPYQLNSSGGEVFPGYMLGFDSNGSGEAVYVQASDSSGLARCVWAARYTAGITAFETPRRIDPGVVETGELSTLPMSFAAPTLTGVAFDPAGRSYISFTLSDGRLSRLYVNRADPADPKKFEGARAVDGAFENSVFSSAAQKVMNQVEPGSGRVYVNPMDGGGFSAVLQKETLGAGGDSVRLWACTYNGFNSPRDSTVGASVIADGFLDAAAARDVSAFAAAGSPAGKGALAYVQNDGTSAELYARYFDMGTGLFDWASTTTIDNGTSASPSGPALVLGSDGAGFLLFLQDSGSGTVQLYARRVNSSGASNVGTTATPGVNEPLGLSGASYLSVQDFSFALDSAGRACVVFLQAKAAGEICAGALRIDPAGLVAGPIEISSASLTSVSAPAVAVSGSDAVLSLHTEGAPASLKSRFWPASSAFAAAGAMVSADVESAAGAVSSFSLATGGGAFVAAFIQDDGVGTSVFARRHASGLWEGSAPANPSGPALASVNFTMPALYMTDSGDGVLVFTENITAGSVNLQASALRGATGQFTTPVYADCDGTSTGYPVVDAKVGLNRATGRGFIAIRQLDDAGRERIYTRGTDLGQASASVVFDSHATDRNEGGAVVSTRVLGFDIEIDRTGCGVLVHSELAIDPDPDLTRVFLFARTIDEQTGFVGPAVLACRMINTGSGGPGSGSDAEGCASAIIMPDGTGDFGIVHSISQNHTTNGYRTRLFATGMTINK